jgi:hypothetical protein
MNGAQVLDFPSIRGSTSSCRIVKALTMAGSSRTRRRRITLLVGWACSDVAMVSLPVMEG